jgi:hypothetical protein
MSFDITANFPHIVFQLSADSAEGIANGDMRIFVGVMLFRVPVHNELFAGDFETDHDFKEPSLPRVMVRECERNVTAGDSITVAFEGFHVSADIRLYGIRSFETSKSNFQWHLHRVILPLG